MERLRYEGMTRREQVPHPADGGEVPDHDQGLDRVIDSWRRGASPTVAKTGKIGDGWCHQQRPPTPFGVHSSMRLDPKLRKLFARSCGFSLTLPLPGRWTETL